MRVILLHARTLEKTQHPLPSRELKWADIPAESVVLPPSGFRFIDLFSICCNDSGQPNGLVPAVIQYGAADVAGPGHRLWRDLSPGRYEFHLMVTATDVVPVHCLAHVEIGDVSEATALAKAIRTGLHVTTAPV